MIDYGHVKIYGNDDTPSGRTNFYRFIILNGFFPCTKFAQKKAALVLNVNLPNHRY